MPLRLLLVSLLSLLQDEVLTHWPGRPNFFSTRVNTQAKFEREVSRSNGARNEDITALFHFTGLCMRDDDSGETFEV